MKLSFKTVSSMALIASLMFLTACDKKKNDEAKMRGNISSSGQAVYSNSLLNGRQIQLVVSDVQKGYQNNYGNTYGNSTVQFMVNVNGMARPLSVSATQVGMNSNYQTTQFNDVNVFYDAKCADYSCDRVGLTIWVGTPNAYEWKQVGVLKVMSQNVIGSAIEVTGPQNTLIDANQMMYQLQGLYSN